MDKRKKYFRAVTVALLLIAFSGYGKISDRAFRMQVVRMIAGEGMIRLVEAQYVGKSSGRENRSYEEAEQKAGNIGSVQKKYGQKAADPVAETLTGRTMRTVPGQHSPLTMAPMQHIHPCFWMACISVEFMPHFFLWEKISREKKKS